MEKPPVLNKLQTLAWLRKKCGGNLFSTTVPNIDEEREAQRDADVEWYEKKIGEIFEEITELDCGDKSCTVIPIDNMIALKVKYIKE